MGIPREPPKMPSFYFLFFLHFCPGGFQPKSRVILAHVDTWGSCLPVSENSCLGVFFLGNLVFLALKPGSEEQWGICEVPSALRSFWHPRVRGDVELSNSRVHEAASHKESCRK